jgi:hypothetical protein
MIPTIWSWSQFIHKVFSNYYTACTYGCSAKLEPCLLYNLYRWWTDLLVPYEETSDNWTMCKWFSVCLLYDHRLFESLTIHKIQLTSSSTTDGETRNHTFRVAQEMETTLHAKASNLYIGPTKRERAYDHTRRDEDCNCIKILYYTSRS